MNPLLKQIQNILDEMADCDECMLNDHHMYHLRAIENILSELKRKRQIVIILDGGLVEQIFTEDDSEVLIIDKDVDSADDEEIQKFNTKSTGDFEGTARIANLENEVVIGGEAKELFDEFHQ